MQIGYHRRDPRIGRREQAERFSGIARDQSFHIRNAFKGNSQGRSHAFCIIDDYYEFRHSVPICRARRARFRLRVPRRVSLWQEAITNSMHREEVSGDRGIGFELLP